MMQKLTPMQVSTKLKMLNISLNRMLMENPEAMAVSDGETHLTWKQMYERAVQIAVHFNKAGMVSGQRLALDGPRSVELYLMVLACLLSGISFISVPRNMSKEQKYQFTASTGCAGICSSSCKFEELHNTHAGEWYLGVTLGESRSGYSNEVYCVRTSGTTGEPKLVPIHIAQINSFLQNTYSEISVRQGFNWSWIHDLSFDFSIWELFGALSYGGCLVVISEQMKSDPAQTREILQKANVHLLSVTPSEFRYLFGGQSPAILNHLCLRLIVFCGEKLTAETLRVFFPAFDELKVQLLNTYGPSEATVFCSAWRVNADDFKSDIIPIGKPFPDMNFSLEECREEGGGNLVLRGGQVFSGYEGRDPILAGYLTGDICRCDNEGVWHYIGRNEGYYKINGFRVDPLEVEEFLQSIPGVCEAVVWLEESVTALPILKACVNISVGVNLSTRDLRRACVRMSPWLRPAHYLIVTQNEWPINSRGKSDRAEIKRKFYGI
ncbi:AMP-binding protein [Pectobacterium parvum]|uniref:AMP-binding protein n=1 Tax=Pectobacterium TaxID=122277 RepID=UPI0013FD4DAC|nr:MULTISPECIES: AMP-binding protein [Pectobacterium]UVD98933.1 AMP-binding protein [Pectobacterium parvum]